MNNYYIKISTAFIISIIALSFAIAAYNNTDRVKFRKFSGNSFSNLGCKNGGSPELVVINAGAVGGGNPKSCTELINNIEEKKYYWETNSLPSCGTLYLKPEKVDYYEVCSFWKSKTDSPAPGNTK